MSGKEDVCKVLGFTQEELQERLLERLTEKALLSLYVEDGEEYYDHSPFAKKLNDLVTQRINETVQAIAEKHVLPRVSEFVETLTLQETNKWGEKTGKPITFIEYLVQRAEFYLNEKVNYEGKSKEEGQGYSWNPTQTRVAHLIHKHLQYSIETAMKNALNVANSAIVGGLQETVKTKLAELSQKLKVEVKI